MQLRRVRVGRVQSAPALGSLLESGITATVGMWTRSPRGGGVRCVFELRALLDGHPVQNATGRPTRWIERPA